MIYCLSFTNQNVKLLLKNGAPYNIKSSRIGRLPLHYAACKTLPTVKALVEYVEDKYDVKVMQDFIDSVDYKAFTSMHLAASFGKWRTVSYLLEKGATLKWYVLKSKIERLSFVSGYLMIHMISYPYELYV